MRVPAAKAGKVAKMFDFECKKCSHQFEAMAKDGDVILCPDCQEPGYRILSCPRVDSHAAAGWRR
jgi:putative FmdB family regulatory protein